MIGEYNCGKRVLIEIYFGLTRYEDYITDEFPEETIDSCDVYDEIPEETTNNYEDYCNLPEEKMHNYEVYGEGSEETIHNDEDLIPEWSLSVPYFYIYKYIDEFWVERNIYDFAIILEAIGILNINIHLDSFLPADKSIIEETENDSNDVKYTLPDSLSLSYIIISCLCYLKSNKCDYVKSLSKLTYLKIKNYYEITEKDWEVVKKFPDYHNQDKIFTNELLGDLCLFFDKDLADKYYNISIDFYNFLETDAKKIVDAVLLKEDNFQIINSKYEFILQNLFGLEANFKGMNMAERIRNRAELLSNCV